MKKYETINSFIIITILIIIMVCNLSYSGVPKILNKFGYNIDFKNIISHNKNKNSKNKVTFHSVDFTKKYPFEKIKKEEKKKEIKTIYKYKLLINKYKEKINKIKEFCKTTTSTDLIGYEKLVEISYFYEDLTMFKLVSNTDRSSRIKIKNNYYSRIIGKKNTQNCTNRLIELNKYLNNQNIDLLYVQAPYKISEQQKISPIYKDYTNENINSLLETFNKKIDYIDLRENIKNENLTHLKLFYKTDHHWLPETGLWAANKVSEYINNNYDLSLKTSNLEKNKFNYKRYPKIYLGSDGRYLSMRKASPEDLVIISPKYKTDLSVKIPDATMDKRGSYKQTLIDWSQVVDGNYYKMNKYDAYIFGNRPLIEIHNNKVKNNKKILIINDSFGQVVIPFLALENEYTTSIDLRAFNGSLKSYIKKYNPNLVMILYNGSAIERNPNGNGISSLWYFQ